MCDTMFVNQRKERKEKTMREFWITVASMVLGYLMYLGVKSMGRK